MRHVIYRFYSVADDPLYIGQSRDLSNRIRIHQASTPWFDDVDHITVQHVESVDIALEAERDAIQAEHPRYNLEHQPAARVRKTGRMTGYNIDEAVGLRALASLRRNKSWLASETGLSVNHVCNIFTGRFRAGHSSAHLIALALDVDVSVLFPEHANSHSKRSAAAA